MVEQVRFDASMTQNVVIYTVVVSTNNADLKLLPYLTANVTFEVNRRDDVLTVPQGALRYEPRPELIVAGPESDATTSNPDDAMASADNQGIVWVRRGNGVAPVEVTLGASDRSRVEVISGELEAGMEVVLGEQQAGVAEQVNNPFAPKMPRSKPRS